MRAGTNGPFDANRPDDLKRAEKAVAEEVKQRNARRRAKQAEQQPDTQPAAEALPDDDQQDDEARRILILRAGIAESLTKNKSGNPVGTVANYATVLEHDPMFADLRYNVLTHRYERLRNGRPAAWTDADDAESILWIARTYGFENHKTFPVAIDAMQRAISYHPLQQLVQSLKWDNTPRIDGFLCKWCGAPDTPYIREASRLLFAGGIHRLFNAGVKFDETLVLTGAQGSGKSTLVRWLAMKDEYFAELLTVDGKQGAETLEGKWIIELSELLAMRTARATEAVKSFLSRLTDTYRPAYGHRVADFPRSCIIIGTSNNDRFINDPTGGRRFYPVPMTVSAEWLYGHEAECRQDIAQCWAEAYTFYSSNDEAIQSRMQPFPFSELRETIKEQQAEAQEDDPRIGLIESWLDRCTANEVCVLMVWHDALNQIGANGGDSLPTKLEAREIAAILDNCEGWQRSRWPLTIAGYGRQRAWIRVTATATNCN